MGTTIAERAIFYANKGFSVFPLYTVDQTACSCGKLVWRAAGRPEEPYKYCDSPGKHPVRTLAPHGVLNASTDAQMIREWWAVYPDANIGIATGDASQLVVLDIDIDHGGDTTLANLETRNGELPPTWAVETGGGGVHFYFKMPNADIRNSAGAIGPGIDVRGNGGYVVAPPSIHASGQKYKWSTGRHPTNTPMADVPEWLLARLAPSRGGAANVSAAAIPARIVEGQRNSLLASAAGTMRRRGFCEDAILAALVIENKRRCTPPLTQNEIERIARSIERYDPAPVVSGGVRWSMTA